MSLQSQNLLPQLPQDASVISIHLHCHVPVYIGSCWTYRGSTCASQAESHSGKSESVINYRFKKNKKIIKNEDWEIIAIINKKYLMQNYRLFVMNSSSHCIVFRLFSAKCSVGVILLWVRIRVPSRTIELEPNLTSRRQAAVTTKTTTG